MLVVLALVVVASPVTASAQTGARVIGCERASERVTITQNSRLDAGCVYTGGFDIAASNVTLDCHGALLQRSTGGIAAIAVSVDANANLANVTIRSCRIDGFGHAIEAIRRNANQLAAGHEYDNYLRNVVIEDTHITGTHAVGIYIYPYVTDTTVRRSTVTGSASTAATSNAACPI
jgi:hypothetical protein